MEIEQQTRYTVFYNEEWVPLSKPVSIKGEKIPLLEVLDSCFANQAFTFAITGTVITIVSRNDVPLQSLPPPRSIMGRITGADSVPLRANIQIMGTAGGTTADANGYFKIPTTSKNVTLLVSHIGYQSPIIKVEAGGNFLYINLEIETKSLDEVISKGYTSATRRNNLATVSKLTAEDIERHPVNNLLAAMEGKIPGMNIIQKGGLPGAEFSVQIRGQRSIGTTPSQLPPNSPLFVIDGVPFLSTSETMMQRTNLFAFSPLSTLDPADIESIEVLRDANSTSMYGSFGANGVVLITTRKPAYGKTTVDVTMYTGWGKITRAPEFMNTRQYLQMRREALQNDGELPTDANAYDLLHWDTTRNTDWKQSLIGGTAHVSNAHIRLSGGSDKTNFTASAGYNKESTVFPGSFGKSLTSLNFQLSHLSDNDKLQLSITSSYGNDRSHLPFRDITEDIKLTPNAPSPFNPDGSLKFEENGYRFTNPYIHLYQPTNLTMERLTTSTRINYKIFPWLQAKTNMGYTRITGEERTFLTIASQDPVTSPTGSAIFGDSKSITWIIEPQLELNRYLGSDKGQLKVLIGTSLRQQTSSTTLINAYGYLSDKNLKSLDNAAYYVISNDHKQYNIESFYGLINYTWDRTYMLELTGREDGSSRFGPDKRFACFGSVAAGWIFSNEAFIQNTFPFISYGKLRASYGTTGNDQIGDYQFLDVWVGTNGTQYPYHVPSFKPTRLYNNDYSWELHKSLDLGFDIGLFGNKILLTSVWNQSRTGNQLIGVTLPTQTGFSSILRNFPAVVQNRNIEFELNIRNVTNRHFKWKTSLNLSFQKNELLKFPGLSSSNYAFAYSIGKPLNLVWRYRSDGVDPSTGVYRILDKNGNVLDIPTVFPSPKDLVALGTYDPQYFGGLQNSFQFSNWQFDLLVQFVKQKGANQFAVEAASAGFAPINQPIELLQHWQEHGQGAPYQKYTQSVLSTAYSAGFFYGLSDASFADASFIRFKNLSVSYNLPDKLVQKMKMISCSLYAQGQNLATFTSYKGYDPESGTLNPTGLPPLKMFAIGMRATL